MPRIFEQLALPRKGSTYEWTQSELFQLADSTFTLPRPADTVRMHVLFLDGQFNGGHLLGLVNNGLPMVTPHEDAAHAPHAGNEGCVMYWAFDTRAALDKVAQQLLGGEAVNLQFDDACKADLAAGRGAP